MRDLRIIEENAINFWGQTIILYRVIEFGTPACYFEHSHHLFTTREAAEAYIWGLQD